MTGRMFMRLVTRVLMALVIMAGAGSATIADPIVNILIEGSVLDVGVIGVSEFQVATERSAVRRALAKITGANPGDTTAAWQRWWKEHGDEWQAGGIPRKAPTTPAGRG